MIAKSINGFGIAQVSWLFHKIMVISSDPLEISIPHEYADMLLILETGS